MPNQPVGRGRKRTPTPLSSFDPRYRDLLLKGAMAPFTLTCESRSRAIRLRQRLNQYRFAAKEHFGQEAEHEWLPLYRCIIQQEGATLTIRPRDSEFDTLIAKGLEGPAVPTEPLSENTLLDDGFLSRLTKE